MRSSHLRAALVLLLCVVAGLALAAKSCPQCGTSNPDNAKFCKNCGYSFPARARPEPQPRPTLRVEVDVQPGVVSITSTPDGATVTIDGRRRGTTPLKLTDLAPGGHELEVTRSGYRGYDGSFVARRALVGVRVTTEPPGAMVLLGGREVSAAPDTGLLVGGLEPGSYIVIARLDGRPDQVQTVTLVEGQPVTAISIRFPAVDGFLIVQSDPMGADLAINGEKVGRTRYFGALKPATYKLELSMGGFRGWRQQAAVRLGDTTLVSVMLTPVRERRWGFLALGLAGVAGGVAGALLGETTYGEYVGARGPDYTADDIAALRTQTVMYDWLRNIAGGVGVLSLGAFLVF